MLTKLPLPYVKMRDYLVLEAMVATFRPRTSADRLFIGSAVLSST